MNDPNKEILINNPHQFENLLYDSPEIRKLLKSTCFDNDYGYDGDIPSKLKYFDYVLNEVSQTGMWLEFGVWEGWSINKICTKTSNQMYGFDSFEGLPEAWVHRSKDFFKVKNIPNVDENVTLVPGWFEDTIPKFIKSKNFKDFSSVIHIDSDLYLSAKIVLDSFKNTIKSGTIIMFDEYFYCKDTEKHEYKAFMEFVEENNIKYRYIAHTDRGCVSVLIL